MNGKANLFPPGAWPHSHHLPGARWLRLHITGVQLALSGECLNKSLPLAENAGTQGGEGSCQQQQAITRQGLGPGFGFFTPRWSRCDQRYGITEGAQEKPWAERHGPHLT